MLYEDPIEIEPRRDFQAHIRSHTLGETIGDNGVRYWGQDKKDKQGDTTAMFICPACGELWRVKLAKVKEGRAKVCCTGRRKCKENHTKK